jgi:4,5-DOPA dioxygenase extradiol
MPTMPAVFIGHGSPMNALENNRFTQAWHDFGRSVPKPRAILAVSAHWWMNATAVTAMESPKTIHDFFGFPDELFAVQYGAPGSPALARQVVDTLDPVWVGSDSDSWGLDHGTWSVLVHMFPDADVPVVQLSLDATKSFEDHVAIGAALAPLRDDGVLIVSSGNVVHNLRRIDWGSPDAGYDWAIDFDSHIRSAMQSDPASVSRAESHASYALASPTPDHFVPLLYTAGLAAASGHGADILVGGCVMGSLSMTSYVVR